jgi:hypothetical protein
LRRALARQGFNEREMGWLARMSSGNYGSG